MVLDYLEKCPLCGHTKFKDFIKSFDFSVSAESFSIQACTNCQLKLTNPRPDHGSIHRYYQSPDYISHSGNAKGLINFLYVKARKFNLKWKFKTIKKYSQVEGPLLDYGCGTGEFLLECQNNGLEVMGVEPAETARIHTNELIIKNIKNDLSAFSGHHFASVTMWHVLEHIHDFHQTLESIKTHILDGGTLFIAIPNPESFDAHIYKEFWAAYDLPRHLWHFSKANIKTLLSSLNLKLIAVKPMKLDAYYISLLSQKYKSEGKIGAIGFVSALWTGLRSNWKGASSNNFSSLLYIIQK